MATAAQARRRPFAAWRATAPGEYLAELMGTFILICFGDGVEALPERAHDKAHVGLFADGAA